MSARASACLAMGLLFTGCPLALEDDYFIDSDAATTSPPAEKPPAPSPPTTGDAAPPDAGGDCSKGGTCPADECHGKDCDKMP